MVPPQEEEVLGVEALTEFCLRMYYARALIPDLGCGELDARSRTWNASRLENGLSPRPGRDHVKRVAAVLKCDDDWLWEKKGEAPRSLEPRGGDPKERAIERLKLMRFGKMSYGDGEEELRDLAKGIVAQPGRDFEWWLATLIARRWIARKRGAAEATSRARARARRSLLGK